MDRMDDLDGRYEGHGLEAGGRTLSGTPLDLRLNLPLTLTQTITLTSSRRPQSVRTCDLALSANAQESQLAAAMISCTHRMAARTCCTLLEIEYWHSDDCCKLLAGWNIAVTLQSVVMELATQFAMVHGSLEHLWS